MNPLKLIRVAELERLVKLQAKLKAEGADVGYINRKIDALREKLR